MDADDIETRRADHSDVTAIADVITSARRVAMPDLPDLCTNREVLYRLGAVVLAKSTVLLPVREPRRIIGFAAIRDSHRDHLCVAPTDQARGVGTRLLAAAQQASVHGLRLQVFQRNARARLFYERRGFRLIGLRDGSPNEARVADTTSERRPVNAPGHTEAATAVRCVDLPRES